MKLQKRTLMILCVAVAVILIGTGITLAYLGTTQKQDNIVSVGYGNQEISEDFSEPSVQQMTNYLDKEVKVENKGTVPCFVRVYAEFSDSRIGDKASVRGVLSNYVLWNSFKTELSNPTNTISPDWQYIPEDGSKLGGYFYYKKRLSPGDVSSALFRDFIVRFGDTLGDSNIDKIQDYDIIVYSETVQSTELDGIEYMDADWQTAWSSFLQEP